MDFHGRPPAARRSALALRRSLARLEGLDDGFGGLSVVGGGHGQGAHSLRGGLEVALHGLEGLDLSQLQLVSAPSQRCSQIQNEN